MDILYFRSIFHSKGPKRDTAKTALGMLAEVIIEKLLASEDSEKVLDLIRAVLHGLQARVVILDTASSGNGLSTRV